MQQELRLRLLEEISKAINFREAINRLLEICLQHTGASGAIALRPHPDGKTFEILATKGPPLRTTYMHHTLLHLPTPEPPISNLADRPNLLLLTGSECSHGIQIPSPHTPRPVTLIRLEWEKQGLVLQDRLRELESACRGIGPILAHFEKFDSQVPQSRFASVAELDRSRLDQEFDEYRLDRLSHAILRAVLARQSAPWAAVFVAHPRGKEGVILQPYAVQVSIGDLKTPSKLEPYHVQASEQDPFYRVLCTGEPLSLGPQDNWNPPFWEGIKALLISPIMHKHEVIGIICLGSETPFWAQDSLREIGEVVEVASLYLWKAILYHQTRSQSGYPLLIMGMPREVLQSADLYADAKYPILLTGEMGTGKELLARYIHLSGPRRNQIFLTFNCAEITEALAESQLFGHMKGSFTGATADKIGLFEQANRGTLFLDEIDHLPLNVQAKLLRTLEYDEVRPIGFEGPPRRVDLKIIVATNKDLRLEVQRGRFLQDLWTRLNIFEIHTCPLRLNKSAIPRLARALIINIAEQNRKRVYDITPRAIKLLMSYDFPGNIRELRNILEYAVISSKGGLVDTDSFAHKLSAKATKASQEEEDLDYKRYKQQSERNYITQLLKRTRGNITEASKVSGLHRTHIYYLCRRLGIDIEDFK
jgi:transcriptional regulator with AAA-type ATPase domain